MSATTGSAPTPALIRRIYRQVLRYAGSAVLYAHPARPNLRALYRPEFDTWMQKVNEGEEKAFAARPEWEEFSRRGVLFRRCRSASLTYVVKPELT